MKNIIIGMLIIGGLFPSTWQDITSIYESKTILDVKTGTLEKSILEFNIFYEETKNTYCVVSTSETRPFGCFILTKGVVKSDGTVWVLDK